MITDDAVATSNSGAMWLRKWAPEIVLAILAAFTFLGFLGSMELWGKREATRAVAEAVDTIDHGHWLVAQIQSRPRLEKPPLPRWTTAALMLATGHRDEWLMRLPGTGFPLSVWSWSVTRLDADSVDASPVSSQALHSPRSSISLSNCARRK